MIDLIFEGADLSGIKLKNRIIRSATHEGYADINGYPTEELKKKYIQLAKGDVGAIITGYAGIQQNGKSPNHNMLMMDTDECVPHYKIIVDAVHEYGTPIILQLAHCGKQTRLEVTGSVPVAPSPIKDKFFSENTPRELTEREIKEIIQNFIMAIVRCKSAGFDGVQIHIAHGYLLSQFISPYSNKRRDKWGGSLENRFRIIDKILEGARKEVGHYPILAKLNAYDGRKNGMRVEEAVEIAKLLESSGCSSIEVSCGVLEDGFYATRGEKLPVDAVLAYHYKFKNLHPVIKSMLKPLISLMLHPMPKPVHQYNVSAAEKIKKSISIPVIVVGGIRSIVDIKDILKNKSADFISMSHPFIIEPNIVKKFQEGKQEKSHCIDCNYCSIAQESQPTRCYYGKIKE